MIKRQIRELLIRIRTGIVISLLLAGLFSAFTGLTAMLSHGAVLRNLGLSFVDVVIGYVVGGIAAGGVLSALYPLVRRSPVIAFVAGAVGFAPFYAAYAVLALSRNEWTSRGPMLVMLCAVLIGGPLGLIIGGWIRSESK